MTTATESGNCFTLLHWSKTSSIRPLGIEPGFSHTPLKRGKDTVNIELSKEAFQPNEVIRLRLNFQPNETTTFNEPVLGRIVIHDEKEVPLVRRQHFTIRPGHYYLFYLSEEIQYLLPKPYATDCRLYEIKNSTNQYLDNPLSKMDCTLGCMAKKTMDLCNCWPPEIPFIKGDDRVNNMKWCNWDVLDNNQTIKKWIDSSTKGMDGSDNWFKNKTSFNVCFADYEKRCGQSCVNNCM